MFKSLAKLMAILILFLLIMILFFAGVVFYVREKHGAAIFADRAEIKTVWPVALVLGAGVLADGRPSPVLEDRMRAAVELYRDGKVGKLLLSGDGLSDPNYNEAEIMRRLALRSGVPAEAILFDDQGVRTKESCARAVGYFSLQEAVVVTQSFHLPRALYLCDSLGLRVIGFSADRRFYAGSRSYFFREIPASLVAFWEINIASLPAPRIEQGRNFFTGWLEAL